jgi:hypothetical protein
MVYSVLERFFFRVWEWTRYISTRPELRDAVVPDDQRGLDLDGYKRFFKRIGTDLDMLPFDFRELQKLQRIRNAIVHQGGWVTERNENNLKPYGYHLRERILIDIADVEKRVLVVEDTCREFAALYVEALRKRVSC